MEYRTMSMHRAVELAKQSYDWFPGPTSVRIEFVNRYGRLDETELDLYERDAEAELEDLWKSLHNELEADLDSIICIEAYGYIAE